MRGLAFALLLGALQEKDPPSFRKDDRLVAAYYYVREGQEPRRELEEMGKAAIDIALVAGAADPLSPALEALEKERKDFPRVGAFLEAALLRDLDFAQVRDRRRFISTVRDSFAKVPSRFRARVEGKVVVWLPPAPPGVRYDKASFEALGQEDWGDVGGPPYLVAEASWKDIPADRTYTFGTAARDSPVFSVSRGREADDGRAYERAWYVALRIPAPWVALETWNAPGQELCEMPDHGRKYLDATRRYVRKFRLAETITLPKGKFTGAPKVLFTTVHTPGEQGLRPVPNDDGLVDRLRLGAFTGLTSKENKVGSRRHLYFDVDDSFCFFERRSFAVTVEFLDAGEGTFVLEYDSADRKLAPGERPVRRAGEVRFTGTGEWRTETFDLPDAAFGNGQKGGADFRLSVDRRGLTVRAIAVLPR